ncbi:MAG: hypothetical protein ISS66_17870 [Desulfobacteraceae bacterium]|nr:hypothetical protein [Desulfobacteraceae bacterium]
MSIEDFGLDRPYGQSERWVLLGDITSSTQFSAEMAAFGAERQEQYLHWATLFGGLIENMLRVVAKRVSRLPGGIIGNTMGDGFLALGVHGHGKPHITRDAAVLLLKMHSIKMDGDLAISDIRDHILANIRKHVGPASSLPELKLKLSLNQGLVITAFAKDEKPPEGDLPTERRFVGDTINYCARVGASAFGQWNDSNLVLTKRFFAATPNKLQAMLQPYRQQLTVRNYPAKDVHENSEVYVLPLGDQQLWGNVQGIAASK